MTTTAPNLPAHAQRDFGDLNGVKNTQDTVIQLAISIPLGLVAFFIFCICRSRWPGLYAARKNSNVRADKLPVLPQSTFGWMWPVYSISSDKVCTTAGLDVYAFLLFFRLAIRFLVIAIGITIIKLFFWPDPPSDRGKGPKSNSTVPVVWPAADHLTDVHGQTALRTGPSWAVDDLTGGIADRLTAYVWMAGIFTVVMMVLCLMATDDFISHRKKHFLNHASVADRTIRFSEVPEPLRQPEVLKRKIAEMSHLPVESVSICYRWDDLDKLVGKHDKVLRQLERTVAEYQNKLFWQDLLVEECYNLDSIVRQTGRCGSPSRVRLRPTMLDWPPGSILSARFVDKIDHLNTQLRDLADQVAELRQRPFTATSAAFVTMETLAAGQLAVQAVYHAERHSLVAHPSPMPDEVVWESTYLSFELRQLKSLSITTAILLLTVVWSVLMVPIAGVLDLDSIRKYFPRLGDLLNQNHKIRSLVQTQLPTFVLTILNIAVTYLYNSLSSAQGMVSRGDIELSVISKNFFFTFFNFFIVFTALGSASLSLDNLGNESLRETLNKLALSIQDLRRFYLNYIILQGFTGFPFRLLQIGSSLFYLAARLRAVTPRDMSEVWVPPVFTYGLYLPQPILIFIICIVYSTLNEAWMMLVAGLMYFSIGLFCYKYQLLYAMDHRKASTGKIWIMICNRIVAGLVAMQITVAGQLALRGAFRRVIPIVPLLLLTVYLSGVFRRIYTPLVTFIPLKCTPPQLLDAVADGESAEVDQQPADADDAPLLGRDGSDIEAGSADSDGSDGDDRSPAVLAKQALYQNPNVTVRLQEPRIKQKTDFSAATRTRWGRLMFFFWG